MQTKILSIDPQRPQADRIQQAADLIKSGQLVAFPTETVYGLGADALNLDAAAKIFAAKQRPAYDPIIVHIAEPEQLEELTTVQPAITAALTAAFWPGPLTIILPRTKIVPDVITANGPTVAVRCPAHPIAQALLRAAGTPIGAPSANRFSHTSPTAAQHVFDDLNGRIPLILDGGPTNVGVESTVLDLSSPIPTVLRPGGIPIESLREVLGDVAQKSREISTPAAKEVIPSPGMLDRHYAPRAPLHLFTGPDNMKVYVNMQLAIAKGIVEGEKVALLLADEDLPHFQQTNTTIATVGSLTDLDSVARHLFRTLRELDTAGTTLILARDFPPTGLGRAIRDRLRRAAEKIIDTDFG